jgi:hypothetical protein
MPELWLAVIEAIIRGNDWLYDNHYRWFIPRADVLSDLRYQARKQNIVIALVCKDWLALIRPWLSGDVILRPSLKDSSYGHVTCQ